MLDLRVYRAAFLPALVAVFVAAFSLADRPAPVTTPLAADTFDSGSAFGDEARPQRNSLNELARSFPDRRPGAPDDAALADRIASTFGLEDRRTRRTAFQVTRTSAEHDDVDLETVVGVRPGLSSRRIVVMANRDARGNPGRAELSATATLLELARLFRQRDLRRTLVLVSTSGATTGFAGARAWAREASGAPIDAVLVLGDIAGSDIRKPWVVPWATDASPVPLTLLRTVESALREEVQPNPGGARASGQWIRRAAPLTVSGQGVVNAEGLPAVLIGASGEVGPVPDAAVTRGRLGQFGRAVLRTVIAIDAAGPEDAAEAEPLAEGPEGIVTMRNVLPDWAVRMLIGTLLLPALLVALDAWFRARRRKLPAGRWARWVAVGALPFAMAWVWLRLLGLTGALDVPAAPVMPAAYPAGAAGTIAALSALLVAAVGWFGVRPLLLRRVAVTGSPAAGGLSAATGMIVTVVAAIVWVANPYAAALLLPAAHLWVFAGSPTSRRGRLPALLMVAGGVVLPLLVLVHYGRALGLDPIQLAWLATLVTAGGHVSAGAALAVSLWLACLAGVLTVVRTRRRVEATAEPEPLRTRGPAGYAGPGSLGGTESALRR